MNTTPLLRAVSDSRWRIALVNTPIGWGITLSLGGLGAYLLVTHAGHFVLALPYLFLLACPLMHVFMHGGYDKGSRSHQ